MLSRGLPKASWWGTKLESGHGGYVTHAIWGVPNTSEEGRKSELAHKMARRVHDPCRMGDPQHFTMG